MKALSERMSLSNADVLGQVHGQPGKLPQLTGDGVL